MPNDVHAPSWHLLDATVPAADSGPALPPSRTAAGGATLRIRNFDHCQTSATPPGNIVTLTPAPALPPIPVVCDIGGFDPSLTPIQWRLAVRHVLSRYRNAGNYRYRPFTSTLEREWRGESRAPAFTIFGTAADACACTYNDNTRVMGGYGTLQVAVTLPSGTLLDSVRLLVTGANPAPEDVQAWLDLRLQGCDPNILRMARAVFAHESGYRQFSTSPQTAVSMTFTRRQHTNPAQPDCKVRFDWPDEPAGFPLASYDFGIGISQWTHPDDMSPDIAWDWRENMRTGVALFLDCVRKTFRPGTTWADWALAAWASYNGSGSGAAAYAANLAQSAEGILVSRASVSGSPEIARLSPPPPLADPGVWVA